MAHKAERVYLLALYRRSSLFPAAIHFYECSLGEEVNEKGAF